MYLDREYQYQDKMKLYTWDLDGFENAYSKYYYKPNLIHGHDEDGHFHDTLHECGRASCICAFEDEIITYSKLFFENDPIFKIRAQNIISKLNIKPGSTIFVAGCAFGFLMEALSENKMNVAGCDNSPYIQFNIDTESIFPIHNIDILDTNFTDLVRNSTGFMYFDYVITEDVLTSYDETNNSYNIIFNNIGSILKPDKPLSNIVNLVETRCGSPFVGKNLVEWSQINPSYTWLDSYGNN